jgi:hypothetical protein
MKDDNMFKTAATAAIFTLALGGTAFAQQQEGLVTVNVSDIEAVSGNTVQVPIGIAAQVCPDLDVNALTDEQRGGDTAIDCTVTQESANEAFLNYVSRGSTNTQGKETAPGQVKKTQ